MAKTGIVYELVDPRDWRCRYVGVTINRDKRRNDHRSPVSYQGNNGLLLWKDELCSTGLFPVMKVIEEEVEKSVLFDRELFWVRKKVQEGCELLNLPSGRIKRSDLFRPQDTAACLKFIEEALSLLRSVESRYGHRLPAGVIDKWLRATQAMQAVESSLMDFFQQGKDAHVSQDAVA